jgi:hypothetical protein
VDAPPLQARSASIEQFKHSTIPSATTLRSHFRNYAAVAPAATSARDTLPADTQLFGDVGDAVTRRLEPHGIVRRRTGLNFGIGG